MIDKDWRNNEYSFYVHKKCEAFPCHKKVDEDDFNCLFCYCPLFLLGRECGGVYYYTPDGQKVCSDCAIPHQRDNYGYIISRYKDIAQKIREMDP